MPSGTCNKNSYLCVELDSSSTDTLHAIGTRLADWSSTDAVNGSFDPMPRELLHMTYFFAGELKLKGEELYKFHQDLVILLSPQEPAAQHLHVAPTPAAASAPAPAPAPAQTPALHVPIPRIIKKVNLKVAALRFAEFIPGKCLPMPFTATKLPSSFSTIIVR